MDLLLRAKGNQQPIEVVLVGGGAPVCFSVPWPNQVIQQHQAWRHRYLIYNDPNAPLSAPMPWPCGETH